MHPDRQRTDDEVPRETDDEQQPPVASTPDDPSASADLPPIVDVLLGDSADDGNTADLPEDSVAASPETDNDPAADIADAQWPEDGPTSPEATSGGEPQRGADLSVRAKQLLRPTSDGGPPLARPVVVVRLPNEKLRNIRDQAVAAAARHDTETCTELAELEVRRAFSQRDGEMRAITGNWT